MDKVIMENNIITIKENAYEYYILFQKHKYEKHDIEEYFFLDGNLTENKEILPGIFCLIEIKHPIVIRWLITKLEHCKGDSKFLKILPDVLKQKYGKKKVTFYFKNIRDSYSLYINEENIFSNKKNTMAKKYQFDSNEYEYIKEEPKYKEISTEKILFPKKSGGEGERCSLKGVFRQEGIFNSFSYETNYVFFNEYEMHSLTEFSKEVRDICSKCDNCMRTVKLMENGEFVGPSQGDDSDCLTVGEYDGLYIIENGNHRACCAKAFGIPYVKAKVHRYRKSNTIKQESEQRNKQYDLPRYRSNHMKELLDTFYSVFEEKHIPKLEVHRYLEEDGSDLGLLRLLHIIN